MTREAFDAMRTVRIFCDCSAIGGPKHIQIMRQMIKNDPRKLNFLIDWLRNITCIRFVFDNEDPYHLLNRPNESGHRPLYIAAKHGNLEVVKLLIENKVNPTLTSKVFFYLWISNNFFKGEWICKNWRNSFGSCRKMGTYSSGRASFEKLRVQLDNNSKMF